MPADGKAICNRYDRLKGDSINHFRFCEEMAPLISPSRVGIIVKRAVGQPQIRSVFDSTSLMANELMAQFIASYTMNPAQRWGSNRMLNPAFRDNDDINEWLEEDTDRMMGVFANSTFYAEGPESLVDLTGFGTGFLLEEELPEGTINAPRFGFRGMRFEAQKTGRFLIADGPDGLVDTVMREFTVTADVMRRRWGDEALPSTVRRSVEQGKLDDQFQIIHAVYPRSSSEREFGAGNKKMPYASVWVEKTSKEVVFESGYRSFPGGVSRYQRTPGEVFGRGRGHIAFYDTWSLNELKRLSLQDFGFKALPPILQAHDSVFGTLRLQPGAPTTVNTMGRSIRDVIAPWETGSRPEVTSMKEEELRKSIRQIFFVDQILALMEVNKSEMTAYEFAKKLELLFRLLGPIYGRIEREFLRTIWDTTFDFCLAGGVFSPPPPAIFETDGSIEAVFDNPISKAQRATDVESITMAAQDLLPLSQVFPNIWDNYDPDEIVTIVNRSRGVPAKATRSPQERQQFRDARFQQQQQEQQLQEAAQIAESAGKAAPMVKALQGAKTA